MMTRLSVNYLNFCLMCSDDHISLLFYTNLYLIKVYFIFLAKFEVKFSYKRSIQKVKSRTICFYTVKFKLYSTKKKKKKKTNNQALILMFVKLHHVYTTYIDVNGSQTQFRISKKRSYTYSYV
jgi:hypothetical protein